MKLLVLLIVCVSVFAVVPVSASLPVYFDPINFESYVYDPPTTGINIVTATTNSVTLSYVFCCNIPKSNVTYSAHNIGLANTTAYVLANLRIDKLASNGGGAFSANGTRFVMYLNGNLVLALDSTQIHEDVLFTAQWVPGVGYLTRKVPIILNGVKDTITFGIEGGQASGPWSITVYNLSIYK